MPDDSTFPPLISVPGHKPRHEQKGLTLEEFGLRIQGSFEAERRQEISAADLAAHCEAAACPLSYRHNWRTGNEYQSDSRALSRSATAVSASACSTSCGLVLALAARLAWALPRPYPMHKVVDGHVDHSCIDTVQEALDETNEEAPPAQPFEPRQDLDRRASCQHESRHGADYFVIATIVA